MGDRIIIAFGTSTSFVSVGTRYPICFPSGATNCPTGVSLSAYWTMSSFTRRFGSPATSCWNGTSRAT